MRSVHPTLLPRSRGEGGRTLVGMPGESVFARLEPLLARVQKPIQYVGGELNSTIKYWDACDVRWALMYPDAYEVGLPNQGTMILYEVLNEQDGVLAERTYAVWPDLEAFRVRSVDAGRWHASGGPGRFGVRRSRRVAAIWSSGRVTSG